MKTKMLILAALIGAASLSARAGVHFGFSIGLPLPVITVAAPAPVVVAAPPVYYTAPGYAYSCPAPVVVTAPPCPAPGYAWAPGYWGVSCGARVWVPGCWHYRGGYGGGYGYHRW